MTAIEIPTPDPRTLDDASRAFAEAIGASYSIKRMLGSGGMGVVYLARDRRLNRLVAIKTLPPALAKDESVRERFLRETRTAGAMSHPNIVPIHGADELAGHVFFVMTYVDGDSLAAHIGAHGRIAPKQAARHLRDVAAALSHAHERGIIHRDIKAENILIDRASGRALVTDFGIARIAEATPLTVTGQVLGTVYYVSPEQVSGGRIDARSDIYSLGVVGFLMLTGRFPFEADVASAVLVAHVTKAAPPLSSVTRDVPPALASIIDRCLAKDPAHRFASADDLLSALEQASGDLERPRPAALPPASPPASPPAPPQMISEGEAKAVWERAAKLQALTGIEPRPAAVPKPRDPSKDRHGMRGDGYALREVREAAAEAGIDERYVEHVLIEHGLVPGKVPAAIPTMQPSSKPATSRTPQTGAVTDFSEGAKKGWIPRPWVRMPRTVAYTGEVEGEIAARDIERLLEVLRDETGRTGNTVAKTRELAWFRGGFGNELIASVVPVDGRTEISLTRGVRRNATLAKLGTWVVTGVTLTPLLVVVFLEMSGTLDEDLGVTFAMFASWFTAVKLGRLVARGYALRAQAKLRRLGERLELKVRQSVDALLPPPRK
jgi:serine/threonine protein kinase